jgi:DHA1 family tetracycline resistance protein-like MFS transporter
MDPSAPKRPASSHSIVFILVTIVIDAIGFGIVMPVLPRLVMSVGGGDISHAVAVGGWMALVYALAQFLCGPTIGNLSDRYGRRPVLLLALLGLVADYLLMAFAQTLPLLFLARLFGGLFGGTYGPAQAAVADMTSPDARARNFGYVGAAFGIGFVIGPGIGGLIAELGGERAPFYAAAALAAMNFVYGLVVFPDTLARENRRPFDWRRANPLGAWRAMRRLPGMSGAWSVLLLWQIASLVYPLVWSYYAIARFGWSNAMIGASLTAVGVVMAISQTLLTGRIVGRYGERAAATIGLVAASTAFAGYALVAQSWMAFALMAFIALQSLVQPSLMAILSRRATRDTQGEVQGIAAMAMGLGSLAAPLLFNPVQAFFTGPDAPVHFAGAAFLVAMLFALLALARLRLLPRLAVPEAA